MKKYDWRELAEKSITCDGISKEEALSILKSEDDDLLNLIDAAFFIRRKFFGRAIRLHIIRNAQSGGCSEDCAFCSQSVRSKANIKKYKIQNVTEIVDGANVAKEAGAFRYCIVTSGKMPSKDALDTICEAAKQIKSSGIKIELCVSVGILDLSQAKKLKESGVDRVNHNLETSERFFENICTTHSYCDRLNTAKNIKAAGLELCSGGLIGMGESDEDRVDLAFSLKELEADSIPVNFLDPREGTPLENITRLLPQECLRVLVMFRFVHPSKEIRAAGGREKCLGAMQPLALYVVNSIFTNGYLTTQGQGRDVDLAMIKDAGFYVENWTCSD